MLTKLENDSIQTVASKYSVKALYLFGSALRTNNVYTDIDLGVEGIAPGEYFQFYGSLIAALDKPIDLIDMSRPNGFTELVRREGVLIYGGV